MKRLVWLLSHGMRWLKNKILFLSGQASPAGAKRLCAVVGAVRLARLRCEG
jgi:hypothetical protein